MAKRGRTPFEPSPEQRKKVADLVASKASQGDIAKMMGMSVPTLRKYFREELFSEKNSASAANLKITPLMRDKVARYIGCGMKPEAVALALDLTEKQLTANFPDEIAHGRAKARAVVIDALHDQMEEGSASAAKTLEALTSIPDGAPPLAGGAQTGKKTLANAQAAAAAAGGGKFAPPAGPRLAVNNDAK